jgi:predicted HD phosphohydrolase
MDTVSYTRMADMTEQDAWLQVTRLEHSLAPYSHGQMVAAILKPYVSDRICWMIEKHGLFQSYYYAHLIGLDRLGREKYRDHPYYQDCVDFCELYDQESFDPAYDSLDLEFFAPMVNRVFGRDLGFEGSMSA